MTVDELLRAHVPSLSDDDERDIEALRWGDADTADLALRTCACGVRVDGFYQYVDHLRTVAGIGAILGTGEVVRPPTRRRRGFGGDLIDGQERWG